MNRIEQIQQQFERLRPDDLNPQAACLYWSIATILVLRSTNRTILQAGTCLWPRIRPDQDDGTCNTHFGYKWDPDSEKSIYAVSIGALPEMHVWTAQPESGLIIDMTTRFFPEQCKNLICGDWPGDLPPEYFWSTADKLPVGVIYHPTLDATRLAVIAAKNILLRRTKNVN